MTEDVKLVEQLFTRLAAEITSLREGLTDVRETMIRIESDVQVQARMATQVEKVFERVEEISRWRAAAEPEMARLRVDLDEMREERDEARADVRKMMLGVLGSILATGVMGGLLLWMKFGNGAG